MKLLSYNSSSMSSSSTSSFDANNICSSKSSTAGCLAGILTRMLCSHGLPTHHSDHISEASSIVRYKNQELESKEKVEDKVVPSVVARLMGLESMPNMIVTSATPSSITRSRSMNSMDCKRNVGGDHHVKGEHRRVKSTLSFTEMPAFLELENEEFILLSFENGSERKEKRLNGRKCEVGSEEIKQRRGGKCRSNESKAKVTEKKKLGRRVSDKAAPEEVGASDVNKFGNSIEISEELPCVGLDFAECSTPKSHKKVRDGAKFSKKRKKKVQILEHECSSEESSPVSVLDFDQFIIDREVPISELDSDSMELNSRRKLSPEPENYECQSRRRKDSNLNIPDDRKKTKKAGGRCVGSRKKQDWYNQNYLDHICQMSEVEQVESNWLYRTNIAKHEDLEDICADFESEILDQFLGELVHQLTGLHLKILNM